MADVPPYMESFPFIQAGGLQGVPSILICGLMVLAWRSKGRMSAVS